MKITDVVGEYGAKDQELDVDLELGVKVIDGNSFEFFNQKIYIYGEEIKPEDEVV